ncbi:tRNA pseudouridine(38-40) synthase TruA [Arthrobacter jiangjiafuii]|uniref:tRNA pseudouridine synthase A n=1 Tax=Arthrobacter jiangjiafuii TaxID=2817475 RepID=A0A975QZS7_9MICC|nr:tRNA pseudouridine synthase A [Arthrobacter jiangjiafuii]MBP3042835.1 tRNA pseudouridine(38-40) synthase TruA [Arthrobacter jiangjiafuii]QWC09452.1 tRNA pseudouridine(38-40) synthase TruA [Arthrobacter jiangjiafuii]
MSIERPAVPSLDGGLFRVRMDLSYDGAPFYGWAVQDDLPTVQGILEAALAVLVRRPVRLTVAGRTDSGVHARGQVVHFDLTGPEWEGLSRGAALTPEEALIRRMRGILNKDLTMPLRKAKAAKRAIHAMEGAITVHSAELAPEGFDARFSALWRRYSYRIADREASRDPLTRSVTLWHDFALDEHRMNAAADAVLGMKDFLSFCKPRTGATTVRELQEFSFLRRPDGVIEAHLQADAFCHNMVRSLVGGAMLVGAGDRRPEWLGERLLARIRDSKSLLAPPHPLILEEVRYPALAYMRERAESTRARRAVPGF